MPPHFREHSLISFGLVPKFAGCILIAFALWCIEEAVRTAPKEQLLGHLALVAIPTVVVGGSGLFLLLRSYRLLAKLWIGVAAILMLAVLVSVPDAIGLSLGTPRRGNPWPFVWWTALFLVALWAAQRFVILADEFVDSRFGCGRQVEPSDGAESR